MPNRDSQDAGEIQNAIQKSKLHSAPYMSSHPSRLGRRPLDACDR